MRVLCNYTPCGPSFVRTGWKRVFEACGHQFYFWHPGRDYPHDAFTAVQPDLFIGTTYELDRATAKCIAARPEMKVALFASAWGPLVKELDPHKYPVVRTTDEEKQAVEALRATCAKPDLVFIHAHGRWLEGTMSGWGELGVPYEGVLNAADTFVYLGGKHDPALACDIGFVGGYWGYKARNLDRFLIPLCHPDSRLDVKIFGNQPWPVHRYLGTCTDELARDLFVSATVCPNVSEPHSTDLGFDCVERPFKVLAAGGFCISDRVAELVDLFSENELPTADTPERFEQLIRYFVENPGSRERYRELGRKKVLTDHTYFDRVHQLLDALGCHKEAAGVLREKANRLGGLL